MGMEIVTDNPVFVRELRRRMRGRGLVVTLCLYIAAMCLGALIIIQWNSEQIAAQRFGAGAAPWGYGHKTATDIGRSLSSAILGIQAILVLIVAPTITAAMVRSEKERQTFDFLRGTAISAPTYVVGALLSTVMYVALALFCALPVLMISYLYGGVSDLVQVTFTFMGVSVVLSSGGLLVSCSTERGRTAHVVLGLLLAIGFAVYYGPWMGANGWNPFSWSTTGAGGGTAAGAVAIGGMTVPAAVFSTAGCLLLSVLMLLVSSRKLFSPEERSLNYRQMTLLYLGGMALVGGWVFGAQLTAAAGPSGSPVATPPALQVGAVLAALVGLGIAVQTIALLSPAAVGSERWRLREKLGISPGRDESWLFVAGVSAGAVVIAGLVLGAVLQGVRPVLLGLAPGAAFLAAHAVMCGVAKKRAPDSFVAARWVLAVDFVVLLVSTVLLRSIFGSWGRSGSSLVGDMAELVLGILSPIEAARLSSLASGDASVAICSAALYAGLAVVLTGGLRGKRKAEAMPGG